MPVSLEDQRYCIPCAFICIASPGIERRRTCPRCEGPLVSVQQLPAAITQCEDFTSRVAQLRKLRILSEGPK